MPRKPKTPSQEPLYEYGVTAGWNPKSQRWTDKQGRITSRARAMSENATLEGGWVKGFMPSPTSDVFSVWESIVDAGSENNMALVPVTDMPKSGIANVLQATLKPPLIDKRPAAWMDSRMRARMLLAEHYYMTEGDASHTCSVPVELVAGDIDVDGPPAIRDAIESLFARTNMSDVLAELWLSQRVYGQAFPYEVWDGNSLDGIVPLPPLHVHIGNDFSMALSSEMLGEPKWELALIESRFPPQMFRQVEQHWNEQDVSFDPIGIDIPHDVMTPIKDIRSFSWNRYAMPMLSLGFRDLTDRTIHEDAVRSVVEGYKYQLWVITVGDMEHPPLPGELSHLNSVLSSSAADRTGKLLWRGGLAVKVVIPEGLDTLIGRGYAADKTRSFFRKMGVTSRVLSGETPGVLGADSGGGTGGDTAALDVSLYMERVRFQEQRVMSWLRQLVAKYMRATSISGVKELRKVQLHFPLTDFEMEKRIKNIFGPMYREGALSATTYLKSANLRWDNERQYKEEEEKVRGEGLLNPPASFAQMVVDQGGQPTKKVQSVESPGSPDKAGEESNASTKPIKVEASLDDIRAELSQMRAALDDAIRKVGMGIIINNPPMPEQHIHMPKQEPAVVNMPPVEFHPIIEGAKLDIHVPEQPAPVIHFDPKIDVPDVVVNVPPAQVTVEGAQIHVPETSVTVNIPKPDPTVVNVQPADVTVNVPETHVTVEGAQVNVPPAEVTVNVPAPMVDVHPTIDVHVPSQEPPVVQNVVNVPEQAAPQVTVEGAHIHIPEQPTPIVNIDPQIDVHVQPANVHVESARQPDIVVNVPPAQVNVTVPTPEVTVNVPVTPVDVNVEAHVELPEDTEEVQWVERDPVGRIARTRKRTRKVKDKE